MYHHRLYLSDYHGAMKLSTITDKHWIRKEKFAVLNIVLVSLSGRYGAFDVQK